MDKKGLVVRNIPPLLPAPSSVPQSSTREAESEPPAVEPEPEPVSDDSSEVYYQSNGPRWTSDVRVEMAKKGLYKKHSINHPLLEGFVLYLRVNLGNRKSKQEVESVSRFMHYMDPNEPSLSFVREVEKVREYFNVLTQTQLSKQTVLNYWKSLKSLHSKDKSLFSDCRDFISPLDGIRAGMSKKVNKELTQKLYQGYGKEKLPADCVAILDVALMDFLTFMRKLQGPEAVSGEALDKNDRLLVLYYLEAIVMLKLLQRPGVVTNMTVEEWQGRTRTQNGSSVAVKEHKTAASQVTEVPLTADQEHWFGLYFEQIRPVMLEGPRSALRATTAANLDTTGAAHLATIAANLDTTVAAHLATIAANLDTTVATHLATIAANPSPTAANMATTGTAYLVAAAARLVIAAVCLACGTCSC
ncbi:hypothetical protein PO909_029717 [Leuciscus waleckii]